MLAIPFTKPSTDKYFSSSTLIQFLRSKDASSLTLENEVNSFLQIRLDALNVSPECGDHLLSEQTIKVGLEFLFHL
jgi:hypothetical protein